jgi:hypothetical protein
MAKAYHTCPKSHSDGAHRCENLHGKTACEVGRMKECGSSSPCACSGAWIGHLGRTRLSRMKQAPSAELVPLIDDRIRRLQGTVTHSLSTGILPIISTGPSAGAGGVPPMLTHYVVELFVLKFSTKPASAPDWKRCGLPLKSLVVQTLITCTCLP